MGTARLKSLWCRRPGPGVEGRVAGRGTAAGRPRQFTIVEILCVFACVGIIFAAVSELLVFSLWMQDHMDGRVTATDLAKNRLERLRALDYSELGDMREFHVQVNAEGTPDAEGGYYRTTIVGPDDASSRYVWVLVKTPGKLGRQGVYIWLATVIMDTGLLAARS